VRAGFLRKEKSIKQVVNLKSNCRRGAPTFRDKPSTNITSLDQPGTS
jgi:hypothetical protein